MGYAATILADSVSENGDRLTTFEVTLPRIVLSEFNTHRMLSRNSASSRAVPISISIRDVEEDPFIPEVFGSHQKGMVEGEPLNEDDQNLARHLWLGARDAALDYASGLERMNVYKGLANRLLEPFKWHTIIATATDWDNFFALRTEKNAQAEIQRPARMMRELYEASVPEELHEGQWHTPLVSSDELASRDASWGDVPTAKCAEPDWDFWVPVSAGRCARVSYNRQHDGGDPESDRARAASLKESYHLSPFEHVARPFSMREWEAVDAAWWATPRAGYAVEKFVINLHRNLKYAGNLRGWWSARMDVPCQRNFQDVLDAREDEISVA